MENIEAKICTVPVSASGSPYLSMKLGQNAQFVTHAVIFRESENGVSGNVTFKIGRYKRRKPIDFKQYETDEPRSMVKLNHAEFNCLIQFLQEKAELSLTSARHYLKTESQEQAEALGRFSDFLRNGEATEIIDLIVESSLNREDLANALALRKREFELAEFDELIGQNVAEHVWQSWFKRNSWVLGSDFVTVLDEREINTSNTADYLNQAADNHLDLIEIKLPKHNFWYKSRDHNNLVPHSDLVKAWTQAQNYLLELERGMDSISMKERVRLPIAKPRALLIIGRSEDWGPAEYQAQRLLNGGLSNVQILTYDQIRTKAERIIKLHQLPTEVG